MNILLETHIFLWYISADPKLPATYQAAIIDPTNAIYLSVASVWEAIIKNALGKLSLPAPPETYLPRKRSEHGISSLLVDEGSLPHLAGLPPIHRDPFDRIIIAQALQHGLTIATVDQNVTAYSVPILPKS